MMFSIVPLSDPRATRIHPCPVMRGAESVSEGMDPCPGCGAAPKPAPSFMKGPLVLSHRGWQGHPDRADALDFQHPDGVIVKEEAGQFETFRLAFTARQEVEAKRLGIFTRQTARLFLISLSHGRYGRGVAYYSPEGPVLYEHVSTGRGTVGEMGNYVRFEGFEALDRMTERLVGLGIKRTEVRWASDKH